MWQLLCTMRWSPFSPRSAFHHRPDWKQESPKSPVSLLRRCFTNSKHTLCFLHHKPNILGRLFGSSKVMVTMATLSRTVPGPAGSTTVSPWWCEGEGSCAGFLCFRSFVEQQLKPVLWSPLWWVWNPVKASTATAWNQHFPTAAENRPHLGRLCPFPAAAASQFSVWVISSLVCGGWRWCHLFPPSYRDLFAYVGSIFFQINTRMATEQKFWEGCANWFKTYCLTLFTHTDIIKMFLTSLYSQI